MNPSILYLYNGSSTPISEIPLLSVEDFRETVVERVNGGDILSALFARPHGDRFRLYAVMCDAAREQAGLIQAEIGKIYPSITADCPSAHWFEREIREQYGIMPFGHPWLKPIRFEPSRTGGKKGEIGVTDFFSIEGTEAHEVAVGPVHAGVIEPGHFRFQCHGETVYHLEISLGYQHRGVERAVERGPDFRTSHYMETLAGDTSIGHAAAHCLVMEALSSTRVPPAAESIRAVAAELERMANHTGDLGALAGDVGFLPTQNYCGRIRGDILNLTALVCGNRFGRNLLRPGGVRFDLSGVRRKTLLDRLDAVEKDLESALDLLFGSSSVLARFEGTGSLSAETARRIGLVGPAARACGLSRDVRVRLPYSAYRFDSPPVSTFHTGDCFARAYVRRLEIEQSIGFIRRQLGADMGGGIFKAPGPLAPDCLAVGLTEGWRGEICHVAATDHEGRFAFYKIVDPSFHNWFGLAQVLRGQQISDFPLCNKSFNLSYCGHDL